MVASSYYIRLIYNTTDESKKKNKCISVTHVQVCRLLFYQPKITEHTFIWKSHEIRFFFTNEKNNEEMNRMCTL